MRAATEGDSTNDAFARQHKAPSVSVPEQQAAAAAQQDAKQALFVAQPRSDNAQKISQDQPGWSDHAGTQPAPAATAVGQPQESTDTAQVTSSSADSRSGQTAGEQFAEQALLPDADATVLDTVSDSASLSPASSAASSEFDVMEAAPYQASQHASSVTRAAHSHLTSPAQTRAEEYTVQRSGYSDTPILRPAASQMRQLGSTSHSAADSAAGMSQELGPASASWQSHESNVDKGQLPAQGMLNSPRKGFSDKPILAVYSRRPSTDEEATEVAEVSNSKEQSTNVALQTKVTRLRLTEHVRCSVPAYPKTSN